MTKPRKTQGARRGGSKRPSKYSSMPPRQPLERGRSPRRRSKRSWGVWVAMGALAICAIGLTALGGGYAIGHRTGAGAGEGVEVDLSKVPASDLEQVAQVLVSRGVIQNATLFVWYTRLFSEASQFRAQRHTLSTTLSYADIASCLQGSTHRPKVKVTLPEGWNRFEIATRLQNKSICISNEFLLASVHTSLLHELGISGPSAEGYLFPATYDLFVDTEPAEVIRTLKAEFDRRLEKLRAVHPDAPGAIARELGWGWPEVVTLASIVEKEAVVEDERPLIAGVFLNRLRNRSVGGGKPLLQSDPTAAYGCWVMGADIPACVGFSGKAAPAINTDITNRYSTYVHEGLPPGAISNPGERSLGAVIAPVDTKYFYFVAKGGGRHAFATTFAEHNENVKKLREMRRGSNKETLP